MFKWLADRAPMARRVREEEQGFTLIELLVVVIIIGILAAIAIPTFLNQRESANEAAAETNLRNAATAQQAYFTENGNYTSTPGALTDFGFPQDGSVTIDAPATGTGAAYCMDTSSPAFHITEADGNPQANACP